MGYDLRPMSDPAADPVLLSLREEIAAADRDLVAAFASRLRAAARIRSHKQECGYALVDPEREQLLLAEWREANDGTVSDKALLELYEIVLTLSKREVSGESRPAERA
jgi:chorismate mutase